MYNVTFSEDDIKLIRWSLQVGADALAIQEDSPIPPEDVMGFISQLETLDASLVSQVKPQRDKLLRETKNPTNWEQLSFDI